MPRIRTMKPEFWSDEKLAPCDPLTRLVFLGLISMADDAGRLIDNLKIVDAFIFPESSSSARRALDELSSIGRIRRGVTASGQRVIQIVNWERHQKIDRASLSRSLPPIETEVATQQEVAADSTRTRRTLDESSTNPRRGLDEDSSTEGEGEGEKEREKEQEQQPRVRATAPAAAAAADPSTSRDALALAVAANSAITARWGEQPSPLLANGGSAYALATAVASAEIPVAFACQVIADVVARSDADRPPRSLKYFTGAISDAWTAEQMRSAVQSARASGGAPTAAALSARLGALARAAWWEEACCRHGWHHLSLEDRPHWIERQRASGFLPADIPDAQLLAEAKRLDQARLIVTGLYNTRTQEQVRREFHQVLGAASGGQAA